MGATSTPSRSGLAALAILIRHPRRIHLIDHLPSVAPIPPFNTLYHPQDATQGVSQAGRLHYGTAESCLLQRKRSEDSTADTASRVTRTSTRPKSSTNDATATAGNSTKSTGAMHDGGVDVRGT